MSAFDLYSTVDRKRSRDPRVVLGQAMLSSAQGPAHNAWTGVSQAAKSILGAVLMSRANKEYDAKETKRFNALASALKGAGINTPAGLTPQDALSMAMLKKQMAPKPPETRTVNRGDQSITQEWDNGSWADVESAPRWEPDKEAIDEFEDVQSPFGFGGAGQRNTRTGKIENYTSAPKADKPDSLFGNGTDAKVLEMLTNGDPASPEYSTAYWKASQPKAQFDPSTGQTVVINPDMSAFRPPSSRQVETKPVVQRIGDVDPNSKVGQEIEAKKQAQAGTASMLDLIRKVREHPGRENSTGLSGTLIPTIPGSDKQDFHTLIEQLEGAAFLKAYDGLKGGGTITEIEGKKAEAAIARLNLRQSDEGFLQALDDLEEVLTAAMGRLSSKPARITDGVFQMREDGIEQWIPPDALDQSKEGYLNRAGEGY